MSDLSRAAEPRHCLMESLVSSKVGPAPQKHTETMEVVNLNIFILLLISTACVLKSLVKKDVGNSFGTQT